VQHGIPSLGDLLAALLAVGRSFSVHVNEGAIQHYSGLFADNYPFMDRFLRHQDEKFPADAPLCAAEGDVPYSYLFAIDWPPLLQTFHCLESRAASSGSSVTPGQDASAFRRRPSSRQNAGDTGYQDLAGAGSQPIGPEIATTSAKILRAKLRVLGDIANLLGLEECLRSRRRRVCHYRRYFDLRTNTWHPKLKRGCAASQVRRYESALRIGRDRRAPRRRSIIVPRPTAGEWQTGQY
jgi:hypothetical protein